MKKTYINPQTQVINIEVQHLLADSMKLNSTTKSYDSSLSRSASFDDED